MEEISDRESDSVSGEAASDRDPSISMDSDQVDESEVIAMGSVDYESASRMEFDRSQRSKMKLSSRLDPHQADQAFMTGLLPLLRKVCSQQRSLCFVTGGGARKSSISRKLNTRFILERIGKFVCAKLTQKRQRLSAGL